MYVLCNITYRGCGWRRRGGEEVGGNCEHNNENSSFLKWDNLLNTWGNTIFCRQTLFHEVSYLFELKKNFSRKIKILSSNLVSVGPEKITNKDRASGPRQRKDIILFNYQNLVAYVTYNWMVGWESNYGPRGAGSILFPLYLQVTQPPEVAKLKSIIIIFCPNLKVYSAFLLREPLYDFPLSHPL